MYEKTDITLFIMLSKGGNNDPYYSVYLNIKLDDDTTVCIGTYIMKKPSKKAYEEYSKIYMALWCRDYKSHDNVYAYLRRLVDLIGVKDAIEHKTDGWKEQYILQVLPVESVDIVKLATDTVEYARKIIDGFGKK